MTVVGPDHKAAEIANVCMEGRWLRKDRHSKRFVYD
jgi:hypothetical protein